MRYEHPAIGGVPFCAQVKFQFVALLEVDTVGEGLDPPLTFRLQNGLFHVGNTVFAYYIQRDRRYVEGGSRPSPTGQTAR